MKSYILIVAHNNSPNLIQERVSFINNSYKIIANMHGGEVDSGISLLRKGKKELVRMILENQDVQLPLTIFLGGTSPLESVVKYLREIKQYSIKEISIRLNRHEQTIWTTYRNSKYTPLNIKETQYYIPLSFLVKSNNSVMESVCYFLKEYHGMKLSEIAALLHRSIKTVWTSCSRYNKKMKNDILGGKK